MPDRRLQNPLTRSGGPRTPAGKARVGRNAVRHGLSIPLVVGDHATAAAARLLAGDDACGQAAALRALEAGMLVTRVQAARLAMLDAAADRAAASGATPEEMAAEAVLTSLHDLVSFDEYERRARSRRRRALLALA